MKIQDMLIRPPGEVAAPGTSRPTEGAEGAKPFASVLKDSISEVNRLQAKADASITALATGEATNVHETMIAMEQASVSFKLMMQVRNKIVEAYQEVMRIQV